jgi:RNA polymerase sigma factor (sigma-70 family)
LPEAPLDLLTGFVHRLAASRATMTDGQLLELYVRDGDHEAFGVLVRRHGPMVLGVCRRALGPTADADDAFQAAFLALVRESARVSESVPGWLFRVAVRTSRRAMRRRRATTPARDVADPGDSLARVEWGEVRRLLDEELDRLPARLRSPLVLCYLDGLTRDEAARQLGWSVRTLHRRLDEGRTRLRTRLTRRGLAPAVLAAVVLTTAATKSEVPAALLEETLRVATSGSAVPKTIRTLVPGPHANGALVMKAILCAVALVGAVAVVMTTRQPSEAGPPPVLTPPPVLVQSPADKEKPKGDEIEKKLREAQKLGIEFLKARQTNHGDHWNWENDSLTVLQPGGISALAVLALLESGLKPDDEVVARGLKHLRTVEPKHTYVVSLQTQVFCRANQKEDAELIKRNVKWLEKSAIWKDRKLEGWSYSEGIGDRTDNSNTRYAIAGLYAAEKAGFKPARAGFWESVREYYLRTQSRDGGWGYSPGAPNSHTMTCSGLLGLAEAKDLIGKDSDGAGTASKRGFEWVAVNFVLASPPHSLYNFDVIAALGRVSEKSDFGTKDKKIEWYRLGTDWLIKNQKVDGSWLISNSLDQYPVITTAFALRFLASRPAD